MVKIIENYSLYQQIGQGQYGKVYRAIDSRNKRQVAVKVINVKKFKQYPKLQQCTLNQIDILSKIDCIHIIKFIEILKTANNFYFFYQFCNQGTLQDKIKKNGPLPQLLAIQYFNQILEAFKILSAKHIMHRDLKPSNILLNDGKIKLADFGFCKTLQNQRDLAQTMLGSPIYMAPEVLKGQIYTVKADIWSLGVVLYQMLYGFCPFQQRSIARLINLLEHQQVVFNKQINKISPRIQQLLRKILVKDHFKRIGWQEVFAFKLIDQRNFRMSMQFHQKIIKPQFKDVRNFNQSDNRVQHRTPLSQKQVQDFSAFSVGKTPPNYSNTQTMFKKKIRSNQSQNYIDDNSQIWIKLHKKLLYYIRIIHQFVTLNYNPSITIQIALKLYSIIQKQHYKLPMRKQYSQQRILLNDTIKIFQQWARQKPQNSYNGPLLNQYIKNLQIQYPNSFTIKQQQKDLIIHCLSLLDLNDISIIKIPREYIDVEKDKLVQQLNQRIIRNTI